MIATGSLKRIKWSECKCVSEFALMLDAITPELRAPLLQAVLFPGRTDFETSYVVGSLRSLLADSLLEAFGLNFMPQTELASASSRVSVYLKAFEVCVDPTQVQLAACDLLEWIAKDSKFVH